MAEELFVDEAGLELNDPPRLAWVRARDAVNLRWRENPKLHNAQEISNSIRRYGFQEPAKFDAKLFRVGQPPEDGEPLGAIKAGNGRVEMVAWLEANWDDVRNDEEGLPRGQDVAGRGVQGDVRHDTEAHGGAGEVDLTDLKGVWKPQGSVA